MSTKFGNCLYGHTGYTYRTCFNATWSDIQYDQCILLAPSSLTYSISNSYYLYSSLELIPMKSGIISTYSSTSLPSGLSLNETSGIISGIPVMNMTNYQVTVIGSNDAGSKSVTLYFTLLYPDCEEIDNYEGVASGSISKDLNGCPEDHTGYTYRTCFNGTWSEIVDSTCTPVPPNSLSYSVNSFYYLYSPLQLVPVYTATITSFSCNSLPSGLSIDENSGIISGIPTTPLSNYQVTVTGSNAGGGVQFGFSLTFLYPGCSNIDGYNGVASGESSMNMNGCAEYHTGYTYRTCFNGTWSEIQTDHCILLAPSSISYSYEDSYYLYSPLELTVTSVGLITSYSSTDLPQGLELNTQTGTVSGIPTEAKNNFQVIVTASNSAGSTYCYIHFTLIYPGCESEDSYEGVASGEKSYDNAGCPEYYSGSSYRTCFNATWSEIQYDECNLLAPSSLSYSSESLYYLYSEIELIPSYEGIIESFSSTTLPEGLSIDSTSGIISGIPTLNVTNLEVTITGHNSAGSISFSIVFTIEYDGCNAYGHYPADVIGSAHNMDCSKWGLNGIRKIECMNVDGKKQWVVIDDGCYNANIYIFSVLIGVVVIALLVVVIYALVLQKKSKSVIVKIGEVYI